MDKGKDRGEQRKKQLQFKPRKYQRPAPSTGTKQKFVASLPSNASRYRNVDPDIDQQEDETAEETQNDVQTILELQEGEREEVTVVADNKNPTTAAAIDDFLGSMRTEEDDTKTAENTTKKEKKVLCKYWYCYVTILDPLTKDDELEKFLNSVTIKDSV